MEFTKTSEIEPHGEEGSTQHCVTPALGLVTFLAAAAIAALTSVTRTPYAISTDDLVQAISLLLLHGCCFGLISWMIWISESIRNPVIRWGCRGFAVVGGANWIVSRLGGQSFSEQLIFLGGLSLTQPIVFMVINTPRWRGDKTRSRGDRKQFSIGEIMTGTLVIALILSYASHVTHASNAPHFWLTLIGIWLVFPMASALGCKAMLDRRPARQAMGSCLALALLSALAVTLGILEDAITTPNLYAGWFTYTLCYLGISLGFLVAVLIMARSGRIDRESSVANWIASERKTLKTAK